MNEVSKIPVPEGLSYLPYQEEGIRFALERRGTLIADEMGLGKTVQGIGIINAEIDKHEWLRVLIIAPDGLRLNWSLELARWQVIRNACTVDIESFNNLHNVKHESTRPLLLIVDEAHYAKNPKAKRTIELKRLAKQAYRVVLLTGTPIDNKPIELWPLLQIVCPERWDRAGKLVRTDKETGKAVCVKVDKGEGSEFFKFAKRYCDAKQEWRGRKKFWTFDGHSNLPELNTRLRETCMVRRMKADVLTQLPPKRRQIVVLHSPAYIGACHDDVRFHLDYLADDGSNYEKVVAALYADKVAFTEFSKRRHEEGIAKVPAVAEHLINTLQSVPKAIVFTHHKDVLLAIQSELAEEGIASVKIDGDMPVEERQDAAQCFQKTPECRVILGTIDAMGVGFTLTAASLVVFAEIDTRPGTMNQAEDRAHRIGQEESVLVQHLVFDRSIDARMIKILVKKQAVVGAALNG
jgi:SWI/SNF-related matrix-associated actin-dependent regulator of chromatin subfamily A-like protein 1